MLQNAEVKYFHLYTQKNNEFIRYLVYNPNTCSYKVAVVLDTLIEKKSVPANLVHLICTPHSYAIKFISDA